MYGIMPFSRLKFTRLLSYTTNRRRQAADWEVKNVILLNRPKAFRFVTQLKRTTAQHDRQKKLDKLFVRKRSYWVEDNATTVVRERQRVIAHLSLSSRPITGLDCGRGLTAAPYGDTKLDQGIALHNCGLARFYDKAINTAHRNHLLRNYHCENLMVVFKTMWNADKSVSSLQLELFI